MTRLGAVPPMPWLPTDLAPVDRKEAEDNWADIHLTIEWFADADLRSRIASLRHAIAYYSGSLCWGLYWKACLAVLEAEARRRRCLELERTDCLT